VDNKTPETRYTLEQIISMSLFVYFLVVIYTFIITNIWGRIRRMGIMDKLLSSITGRDRYESVALKFYTENLGKNVAITCKNNIKYVGVLRTVPDNPDNINNNALILSDPYTIENSRFVKMAANEMLLYFDNISQLEVLKKYKE
jgi:hypothetical protein